MGTFVDSIYFINRLTKFLKNAIYAVFIRVMYTGIKNKTGILKTQNLKTDLKYLSLGDSKFVYNFDIIFEMHLKVYVSLKHPGFIN